MKLLKRGKTLQSYSSEGRFFFFLRRKKKKKKPTQKKDFSTAQAASVHPSIILIAMKKYAFLVGINEYKLDEINNLAGCINDVNNIKEILDDDFDICELTGNDATRDNIISCFRTHLGQAKEGELAFFYFSGHGFMEISPGAFINIQQDNKHECIVCCDSYTEGDEGLIYGIADKEVKLLIKELTDKKVEVVVIYDCCHSGSGVRDFSEGKFREIVLNRDITRVEESNYLDGTFSVLSEDHSNVLFLAACKPRQKAKEKLFANGNQGVFTYSLLRALKKTDYKISYENLANYCYHYIKRADPTTDQVPQMEPYGGFDTGKIFLTDNSAASKFGAQTINYNKGKKRWHIAIGLIHGLKVDSDKQATFKIFEDTALEKEICNARIKSFNIANSTLEDIHYEENVKQLEGAEKHENAKTLMPLLNTSKIYYAIPTFLPIEKIPIYLSWAPNLSQQKKREELLQEFYNELENKLAEGTLLECIYSIEWILEEDWDCLYELKIKDVGGKKKYIICYKETQHSLLPHDYTIDSIDDAAKLLLHLSKWHRVLGLDIDRSGIHLKTQNEFSILFKQGQHEYNSNEFTLDYDGNKIPFSIEVSNNTTDIDFEWIPLYISRKIKINQFIRDPLTRKSQQSLFGKTRTLSFSEKDLNNYPLNQVTDTFKFIVSTIPFPFADLGLKNTLKEEYIKLNPTRSGVGKPEEKGERSFQEDDDPFKKWFTKTLTIKLLRKLGEIKNEVVALANKQIVVHPHESLKSDLSLASSAKYMRGPNTDRGIKLKMEHLGFDLVDFSPHGNKETILELHHLENEDSLKNAPLIIDLNLNVSKDTHILALTLPPSLDEQQKGNYPGNFQVIGFLNYSQEGIFRLSLTSILKNPHDGRNVPGKSLKISFIKMNNDQKKAIDNCILVDDQDRHWLNLENFI